MGDSLDLGLGKLYDLAHIIEKEQDLEKSHSLFNEMGQIYTNACEKLKEYIRNKK